MGEQSEVTVTVKLKSWMPVAQLPPGRNAPEQPAPVSPGRGQPHAMTGNDAVACAFKQIDPHVAAAYPITPQSELMHRFAEFVARRQVRTELVTVESEHSAMSATLAASAAGARAFTATSANGLAYMMEVYHNAGALRLPIVLSLVNRHIGGLLNIHNDHSDAMLARNAAWIQIHAENAQEAYDNTLQAFRIAEDERLRLPVTICHDGFIVSHAMEKVLTLNDDEVQDFVGPFIPPVDLLDIDHPHAVGPLVLPDWTMNLYAQISETMRWAPAVIAEIGHAYGELTGREYDLLESYRMEDAEVAILAMGSVCGTIRKMVDLLRSTGVRAGLVKLRLFRPFPNQAVAEALDRSDLKAVAIIDKTVELGSGGPLFVETLAALAQQAGTRRFSIPNMTNVILGIGGRDVTMTAINGIFNQLIEIATAEQPVDHDPVRFMDIGDQGDNILIASPSQQNDQESNHSRNIVMMARGGQGVKTATYLMTQLMIDLGKYAQGFPTYGPERTGAPIKAFTKISNLPIHDRQQIYAPDVFVVFDETLLNLYRHEFDNLPPEGILIVNTAMGPADLQKQIGLTGRQIYTVDATGIVLDEFGANHPNTVMMAALITVLGLCDLEQFKAAFQNKMKRLSDKMVQGNLRAVDRAAGAIRSQDADGELPHINDRKELAERNERHQDGPETELP